MDEIRIDQSHCNYHLRKTLTDQGWDVLFADGGRVSRGGAGSQGSMLRLFEENRLPIPDIVAIRQSLVLVVEVDDVIAKAEASLRAYQRHATFILAFVRESMGQSAAAVLVPGFCRSKRVPQPESFNADLLAATTFIDFSAAFAEPRTPVMLWRG